MADEITVSGASAIEAKLKQLMERKQEAIKAAINKAAFDTEALAKANAPVDTGFMKSSIHAVPGEGESSVNVGASYSWYVELGTHKMKAQPFLFPAYIKNVRVLKEVLRRIMEA